MGMYVKLQIEISEVELVKGIIQENFIVVQLVNKKRLAVSTFIILGPPIVRQYYEGGKCRKAHLSIWVKALALLKTNRFGTIYKYNCKTNNIQWIEKLQLS